MLIEGYYIIEQVPDSTRTLAWDRPFTFKDQAERVAKNLSAESRFIHSELLIGYWNGSWSEITPLK